MGLKTHGRFVALVILQTKVAMVVGFICVSLFSGGGSLLYPSNVLALQLGSLYIQLISQSSKKGVSNDDGKAKTPD